MWAELAIENRHNPIVAGEHLSSAAGVARFIAIPKSRDTEIGEEHCDRDKQDNGNLTRSASHGWFPSNISANNKCEYEREPLALASGV